MFGRFIQFLLALFIILTIPKLVLADQLCDQKDPCINKSGEDKVSCYMNVVNACGQARETLASQINYMNNKINLTLLQIENTRAIIQKLSNEINDLGDEIVRLETMLTTRSGLILHRIPESYKRTSESTFGILLFSPNFFDFITRAKYISAVEKEDAALLLQLKATQNNYSERKSLREDKKVQQENAKREFENQTALLSSQKKEKDALLAQTQNNEVKYKQLLDEARKQVAAFRQFVTNSGGASILSNQTVCNDWGCYYNQRDSQWGTYSLGGSNLSVAEYGCLVTSMAMVATHYKKDIKPSDIARDPTAFFSPDRNTALLWKAITVKGVSITRSWGSLDGELSAGRPVIVGIGAGPSHFIVIKSGGSGKYIMNDPFLENGHDVDFSAHYSLSSISEVDRVDVN